jgi:hypothetical protein
MLLAHSTDMPGTLWEHASVREWLGSCHDTLVRRPGAALGLALVIGLCSGLVAHSLLEPSPPSEPDMHLPLDSVETVTPSVLRPSGLTARVLTAAAEGPSAEDILHMPMWGRSGAVEDSVESTLLLMRALEPQAEALPVPSSSGWGRVPRRVLTDLFSSEFSASGDAQGLARTVGTVVDSVRDAIRMERGASDKLASEQGEDFMSLGSVLWQSGQYTLLTLEGLLGRAGALSLETAQYARQLAFAVAAQKGATLVGIGTAGLCMYAIKVAGDAATPQLASVATRSLEAAVERIELATRALAHSVGESQGDCKPSNGRGATLLLPLKRPVVQARSHLEGAMDALAMACQGSSAFEDLLASFERASARRKRLAGSDEVSMMRPIGSTAHWGSCSDEVSCSSHHHVGDDDDDDDDASPAVAALLTLLQSHTEHHHPECSSASAAAGGPSVDEDLSCCPSAVGECIPLRATCSSARWTEKVVAALEKVRVRRSPEKSAPECVVCMEPLLPHQHLVRSSLAVCGKFHMFHCECLPLQWAQDHGCPLCRRPVFELRRAALNTPFMLHSSLVTESAKAARSGGTRTWTVETVARLLASIATASVPAEWVGIS